MNGTSWTRRCCLVSPASHCVIYHVDTAAVACLHCSSFTCIVLTVPLYDYPTFYFSILPLIVIVPRFFVK